MLHFLFLLCYVYQILSFALKFYYLNHKLHFHQNELILLCNHFVLINFAVLKQFLNLFQLQLYHLSFQPPHLELHVLRLLLQFCRDTGSTTVSCVSCSSFELLSINVNTEMHKQIATKIILFLFKTNIKKTPNIFLYKYIRKLKKYTIFYNYSFLLSTA